MSSCHRSRRSQTSSRRCACLESASASMRASRASRSVWPTARSGRLSATPWRPSSTPAPTGPAEFAEQVGAVLDGAACRSDLEVLALLEWRITRTTQALQLLDLSGPGGDVDPLARTILLTTAALSGLLAAAVTMRNAHRPATATRESARALRAAVKALDEAAADVRRHDVTAQLLELTD